MNKFSKDGASSEGGDECRKHDVTASQDEWEESFTVENNDSKPVRDWTSENVRESMKEFQASLLKSTERFYPVFMTPASSKCDDKEDCDDTHLQKEVTVSHHENVVDIAQKLPGRVSDAINKNLVLWRTSMLALMAGGMVTVAWLGHVRLLRRWTQVEDIPRQYYATRKRVRVRVMDCRNGVIFSEHIPTLLRVVPNFLRPTVPDGGRTLIPLRIPGVKIEKPGEQWIRQNRGRVAQVELLFPERMDDHQHHPSVMVFLAHRLGGLNFWRKIDVGEYLLQKGFASLDDEDYSTTDPYSHNLAKKRVLQLLSQV